MGAGHRDVVRRDLRGVASNRGRPLGARRTGDSLAGHPPRVRRRCSRAGEPGARAVDRLGGRARPGRRRNRPPAGGRHRRHRRTGTRRRAARRPHVREDARLHPRPAIRRREPHGGASLRPHARGSGAGSPVRGTARERRPHHVARRPGVGGVPAAGADTRRRRRRGLRQGLQTPRPGLPRRTRDRTARP